MVLLMRVLTLVRRWLNASIHLLAVVKNRGYYINQNKKECTKTDIKTGANFMFGSLRPESKKYMYLEQRLGALLECIRLKL